MNPKAFREKMRQRQRKLEAEIKKALETVGLVVTSEAKRLVQKSPRGGVVYEKYQPRRTHKASAPGEPPATDTGALVSSISYVVQQNELVVIVKCSGAIAPYAIVLEYGSSDGELKPRPFLRPAVKNKKQQAVALAQAAIKRAVQS